MGTSNNKKLFQKQILSHKTDFLNLLICRESIDIALPFIYSHTTKQSGEI